MPEGQPPSGQARGPGTRRLPPMPSPATPSQPRTARVPCLHGSCCCTGPPAGSLAVLLLQLLLQPVRPAPAPHLLLHPLLLRRATAPCTCCCTPCALLPGHTRPRLLRMPASPGCCCSRIPSPHGEEGAGAGGWAWGRGHWTPTYTTCRLPALQHQWQQEPGAARRGYLEGIQTAALQQQRRLGAHHPACHCPVHSLTWSPLATR